MQAFFSEYGSQLMGNLFEHIIISSMALLLGTIIAIPLGVLLTRTTKIAGTIISITSALQTIPALALLTLMIPFLGVGRAPAIVALFIYSLLPILRNTYIGMQNVDDNYLDVAKGMGMTNFQSIIRVELPIAVPTIMAGVRLAATYVIAWATLASYIGAGGLGVLIFSGLDNYQPELIIGGTIPAILLAIVVDYLLEKLENFLTPISLRGKVNNEKNKKSFFIDKRIPFISRLFFPRISIQPI
ncbi:choline ABC transporter permease [Tetragenococcus muriaticus]|nr:choline ABC transporter permease [Tetragenococcus muriaticus]